MHEDQVQPAVWQAALVVLAEQSGRVPLHPPLDSQAHPALAQVSWSGLAEHAAGVPVQVAVALSHVQPPLDEHTDCAQKEHATGVPSQPDTGGPPHTQPDNAEQALDEDTLPHEVTDPEQLPTADHVQPVSAEQAVDVVLALHGGGFPEQRPAVGPWQPNTVEQNPTASETQDVGLGVPVQRDPAPPSISAPVSPASPLLPELVVPPVPWPPEPVTPPVALVPPAPPLRGAQHCCIAQVQPAGHCEEDVHPVLLVPPLPGVPPLPVVPPTLGTPPAPVVPPVAVAPPRPPAPPDVVPPPPLPKLPAKPPPVPGAPPRALPPVDVGASVEMAASDDEALPLLLQPVPANGSVPPTMINHQGAWRRFTLSSIYEDACLDSGKMRDRTCVVIRRTSAAPPNER